MNKVITNILGKKRKIKDSDGDSIADYKDCQPHNTMRQDNITNLGAQRIMQMNAKLNAQPQPVMSKKDIIKSKIY